MLLNFVCRASIVPVFSFGETNIYDQLKNPEGSFIRNVQNKLRKAMGLAPCVILGRGVFQYSFGIIPQRRPITTVGMFLTRIDYMCSLKAFIIVIRGNGSISGSAHA